MSAPIEPAAPPLFSTMTVWPHLAPSFWATMRAPVSVPPPGGNGTIIVTAWDGNAPCANAALQATAAASEKRMRFMVSAVERRPFRIELPAGHQVLHRGRIIARAEAVL